MVSIMFHIHYNVQGRRRIYFTRRLFITCIYHAIYKGDKASNCSHMYVASMSSMVMLVNMYRQLYCSVTIYCFLVNDANRKICQNLCYNVPSVRQSLYIPQTTEHSYDSPLSTIYIGGKQSNSVIPDKPYYVSLLVLSIQFNDIYAKHLALCQIASTQRLGLPPEIKSNTFYDFYVSKMAIKFVLIYFYRSLNGSLNGTHYLTGHQSVVIVFHKLFLFTSFYTTK